MLINNNQINWILCHNIAAAFAGKGAVNRLIFYFLSSEDIEIHNEKSVFITNIDFDPELTRKVTRSRSIL